MGKMFKRNKINESVAIVIGNNHYNTLGMLRSVGKTDTDVVLILNETGQAYVSKSRFAKTVFIAKSNEEVLELIKKSAVKYNKAFLFPLTDSMAILLDKCFDSFPHNVFVPNMRGRLMDYENKQTSKTYAQKSGLLVPQSIVLDFSKKNEVEFPSRYPLIIKPLASVEGFKSDIRIVYNDNDYKEYLSVLKARGYSQVLVEEFIDGKKSYMIEVMGYSTSKGVKVTGVVNKIREYPISNGSTSFAMIVDVSDGVDLDAIKRYIKTSGFVGLFDIELKYADGKVFFIECNFRNGAPNYAITLINKINTPFNWMIESEGGEINDSKFFSNRRFMVEQTDILNCLKGNVRFLKWVKDFLGSQKVFWSFSDMSPCFFYYFQMSMLLIKRMFRKVR